MNKKIRQALSWRGIPLSVISDRSHTPVFEFVSEELMNSEDLEFLGFNSNTCIPMHQKFTWANIGMHIGLFQSVGVAKKSGWFEPIESGYSEAFFSRSDGTPLFVFILK